MGHNSPQEDWTSSGKSCWKAAFRCGAWLWTH